MALAALAVGTVSCESDQSSTSPRSAEELAATLISVDDYEGTWTVNTGPDDSDAASTGVVPDDLQGMLPRLDLCDAASDEARTAVQDMRWMAFRQLDLTVDDPIRPPDREGHMVFVQEFLTSDEPADIEATFGLLRDGMEACLGDIPAGEEGPGTAEVMTVPDVGEDRYGVLVTVEEAGGWAEWRLHNALVREGPVLLWLNIVDIRAGEGVEPFYTVDEIGAMVETAVSKV